MVLGCAKRFVLRLKMTGVRQVMSTRRVPRFEFASYFLEFRHVPASGPGSPHSEGL